LGLRYKRHWALSNCTLEVPEGAVCGLIGPNGAGKTTLLSIAAGLLDPSAGDMKVLGGATPSQDIAQLARIGFVAQQKPLYNSMRVSQLLDYCHFMNTTWDMDWITRRLDGLGIPLDRRAGKLSGGQQAQVALALALAKRPELLLLDEPVANLDPLARRDFLRILMESAAETGVTIVLSSHLVGDLERVCDHLILLATGRVQLTGHTEELIATHHHVTAPPERLRSSGWTVIEANGDGRVATAVIRGDAPLDPAITHRPPTIEELVLAYMAADIQPPEHDTTADVLALAGGRS
jgi:ABC-2 type transport system ATP-binding protein